MSDTPSNQNPVQHPITDEHPLLRFFKGLFDRHGWLVKMLLLPEFYSFLLMLLSASWLFEHYFALMYDSPERANHLWKIIGYHLSGGAAFGVLKGAAFNDLTLFDNILCNSLITASVILFFNTLFSLSCRKLFRIKLLEQSFSNLTSEANAQKKTWVKFGIPGVFAFVFFPMTGTGPVIGSVIGRLIGLGFWTCVMTVLAGSLASIVTFALAADRISDLVGDKMLSRIAFGLIVLLLLTAGFVKLRSWLRQRKLQKENASEPPAESPDSTTAP